MQRNYNEYDEIGYEGTIEDEGSDFVLLPEGDYEFTVSKVVRTRHEASANLPECNEVDVELTIWGASDKTTVTTRFFLVRKFEWKLSQFFRSIGLKKHGEPLNMRWNIEGYRGKCRVIVNKFQKRDGTGEGQNNEIKKFYAPEDDVQTVSAPVQQYQAPPAQYQQPARGYQQPAQQPAQQQTWQQPQQSGGWKPGQW